MNRLIAYAVLVRPRELLKLALLLIVAEFCIVLVGLPSEVGRSSVGGHFYFMLLAVLLVGAAGFAFNDYCDAKQDCIEKGKTVIVGRMIVRRSALGIHIALTALGVVSGVVAAWMVRNLWLSFLFPVAAGLCWYYSTLYQRQFVIGNLMKAILVGGCALLPTLFEVFHLEETAWRSFASNDISIMPMLLASLTYAGMIGGGELCVRLLRDVCNFTRGVHCEKDTLVFRYGMFTAKMVAGGMLAIYIFCAVVFFIRLVKFYVIFHLPWLLVLFGVLFIAVPLLASLMALLAAQQHAHFKVSRVATEVGVLGVLLLPAFFQMVV